MGLTIRPEERDYRDLSRLTLTYGKGKFETPNRMVTKNDLNAKSGLGADIPLTGVRNLFLCEEKINQKVLDNIVHKNGFLAEFILKIEKSLSRVDNSKAMKAIFPKVTGELMPSLVSDHNVRNRVINFILQLTSELKADLFLFQMEMLSPEIFSYLNSTDIQYVPVLDIHNFKALSSAFPDLISVSAENVPMIGFTYASYRRANLSFNYVMSNLDKVHEANKGIITVGAPRVLSRDDYDPDVSAPHYSSFLLSDIVAEGYHSHYSSNISHVVTKIFEKKDLAVPPLSQGHDLAEHLGEESAFLSDPKLKDLFWRTLNGNNTDEDIKRSRPGNISRIHEALETTKEYEKMKKSIINHELLQYRRSKARLNNLLNHQGHQL